MVRDSCADEKLIDRIYEAAVLPELWPAVLDDLTIVGKGAYAALYSRQERLPLHRHG
jgi:hypothetical protein